MLDTREVFATIDSEWTVPRDLPYFDGHFPGQPVFPAVGIVDASLALVRARAGHPELNLLGIASAKFTNPIGPEQRVRIEAAQVGESEWQVDWSDASVADRKFASIRLVVGG